MQDSVAVGTSTATFRSFRSARRFCDDSRILWAPGMRQAAMGDRRVEPKDLRPGFLAFVIYTNGTAPWKTAPKPKGRKKTKKECFKEKSELMTKFTS